MARLDQVFKFLISSPQPDPHCFVSFIEDQAVKRPYTVSQWPVQRII